MPIYKRLTRSDIPEYLKFLQKAFEELRQYKLCTSLFYCILCLYEYCQCYAYFMLTPAIEVADGAKISLKTLKEFLIDERITDSILRNFCTTRNSIGHLSKELLEMTRIKYLLQDESFYLILETCGIPTEIIVILQRYYSSEMLSEQAPQPLVF